MGSQVAKGCPQPNRQFRAFRYVARRKGDQDLEGHKAARRLMEENPAQFWAQFERLERDYDEQVRAWKVATGQEVTAAEQGLSQTPAPADERQEMLEGLIEELLAKAGGG